MMGSGGVVVAVLLSCALFSVVEAEAAEGHPIEKVISMLQDMQVKAKDEHAAEAASYQKFAYWCKHADADLSKSIAAREERLKILEDKLSGTKLEIEGLKEDINKTTSEIEERKASVEKAAEVREEQQKDYEDEKKDLEDTIKGFEEAIKVLEPHAASAAAGASAVQLASKFSTLQLAKPEVKRALALAEKVSKLQVQASPDAKSTGRVETYKSKSGGVVDMLKDMLAGFKRDLVKNEQEETNSLNAFSLANQAQEYAISEAEEAKETKTTMKADAEVTLANLELEEGQDKDALKAETEALDGAKTDCDTRAAEWEERTKTRENEIAAIAKAIEILGEVVHVRNPETHEIPARSKGGASSFLQIARSVDGPKQRAVNLLKQEATKFKSKSLQKLAEAIANTSSGTPFDKVNNMIQKMIYRLQAEQKDEDAHKNWCDAELDKTEESKSDKETKMEILNGKIDSAQSKVTTLTEDISVLMQEVADITAYIIEEEQIRKENKAENKAAIKDAKEAQDAIARAVDVLKAHYQETGDLPKEDYELLQQRKQKLNAPDAIELPEQPSTWDAGYTGVKGDDGKPASAGVLAMLETINEDFATMEAETKAQEETDEKDFQSDMFEQKALKKDKEREQGLKEDQIATEKQKLEAMQTEKRHLTTELEATKKYLKDLEPACVTGDSSYEERKQARTDEIEALKKAQEILSGAFKDKDGFLQGAAKK